MRKEVLVIFQILLFFCVVFATNEKSELSLDDLFQIKVGSFLDLNQYQSPVFLTVITSNDIERSNAKNLSDLLEIYVPSFQYMVNKWNGTIWALRGVVADRNTKILVLLNGKKINSESRDGFNLEQTLGLLNYIDEIEVLSGPAGIVYGSGAIGGVINIITKKESKNSVSLSYGSGNRVKLEGSFFQKLNNGEFGAYAGYLQSNGLSKTPSRIYGKASWPFPNSLPNDKLEKNGVLADSYYETTPGNYSFNFFVNKNRLNIYFRTTRQVEEAGVFFPIDLWPEVIGEPDSSAGSRILPEIGKKRVIQPYDGFYSLMESYSNNQREYINESNLLNVSYEINGKYNDNIKLEGYLQAKNNITSQEKRDKYLFVDYRQQNFPYIDEEFGEKNVGFDILYHNSYINKFQFALGSNIRKDIFGKDIYGINQKTENSNRIVISNTNYYNIAIFGECFYNLNSKVDLDFGLRFDKHTKANMLSAKFATLYYINDNNVLKFIAQNSQNNGSPDNYEYNRWHYDSDGNLIDKAYFERPFEKPTIKTDILQPAPTKEQLNSLEPEMVGPKLFLE